MKRLPTKERLEELFEYDPQSGYLIRKIKCNNQGKGFIAGRLRKRWISISVDTNVCYAHDLIWLMVTGDEPEHREVTHINGDRGDNSWANLQRKTN